VEYGWKRVDVGAATLTIVKPCSRCVMTTIDQTLGAKTGKEPLATLGRAYFLTASVGAASIKGAIFGENAIATREGFVTVGDAVSVREAKPRHAFRAEQASVSVAG
jgi:uncharacterized protein YcbX